MNLSSFDEAKLFDALRKADAAGDTQAVDRFSSALREKRKEGAESGPIQPGMSLGGRVEPTNKDLERQARNLRIQDNIEQQRKLQGTYASGLTTPQQPTMMNQYNMPTQAQVQASGNYASTSLADIPHNVSEDLVKPWLKGAANIGADLLDVGKMIVEVANPQASLITSEPLEEASKAYRGATDSILPTDKDNPIAEGAAFVGGLTGAVGPIRYGSKALKAALPETKTVGKMHHGTRKDFNYDGGEIYGSSDPKLATTYAGPEGTVNQVDYAFKNPLEYKAGIDEGGLPETVGTATKRAREIAREGGHDGIIVRDAYSPMTQGYEDVVMMSKGTEASILDKGMDKASKAQKGLQELIGGTTEAVKGKVNETAEFFSGLLPKGKKSVAELEDIERKLTAKHNNAHDLGTEFKEETGMSIGDYREFKTQARFVHEFNQRTSSKLGLGSALDATKGDGVSIKGMPLAEKASRSLPEELSATLGLVSRTEGLDTIDELTEMLGGKVKILKSESKVPTEVENKLFSAMRKLEAGNVSGSRIDTKDVEDLVARMSRGDSKKADKALEKFDEDFESGKLKFDDVKSYTDARKAVRDKALKRDIEITQGEADAIMELNKQVKTAQKIANVALKSEKATGGLQRMVSSSLPYLSALGTGVLSSNPLLGAAVGLAGAGGRKAVNAVVRKIRADGMESVFKQLNQGMLDPSMSKTILDSVPDHMREALVRILAEFGDEE